MTRSSLSGVTRRELMALLAAGGIGSLAGCEHKGQYEKEGIPISRDPGWTAQYGVYNSEVETNNSVGESDTQLVHRTITRLQYLQSEWVDVGNPQGKSDGAWKHTFMLSSTSFGLERPVEEKDGEIRVEGDWTPSNDVNVRPAGFWINTHSDPFNDKGWSIDEEYTDPVAVSVPRDPDLYAFLDPGNFATRLRNANQEVRDELARDPRGVTTTNITRTKARIEDRNSKLSLGVSALAAIVGAATSWTFIPSFVLAAGFQVVDWALTGFDVLENPYKSKIAYNYGVSNKQPSDGAATGNYVMFDVYVAPDETGGDSVGKFTIGSEHGPIPAWKVKIGRSKPKDQLDLPDSESSEESELSKSEVFTAEIESANFNSNRNHRDHDPVTGSSDTIWKPRPQPGIAGPLKHVPSGEPVEYSANQTILAGSHVEEYRWRTYYVSDAVWKQYQKDMVSAGKGINIESLRDRVPIEGEFRGKFPEIEYEQSGRYILELEVEDQNTGNEPGAGGVTGRTLEFVDVDTKAPEPEITVREGESDDEGVVLSAEETNDPDNDRSELEYEWMIAGPFPEEVAEFSFDLSDLPSLDSFHLLSLLRVVQTSLQTETGMKVPLSSFDTDDEVYVALLTATDPSGAWGRTLQVIEGVRSCEPFDEDVDAPHVATGELSNQRELDQYVFELWGEAWGGDVTITVEARAEDDLDLYVTLDGREPTLVDYDRKSHAEGQDEVVELTAPDTKVADMGIAVGLYDGECGAYRLTIDAGSGGELRQRDG